MIDTIFIDFDGVLRYWSGTEIAEAEQQLGLAQGCLFDLAFEAELVAQAVTGRLSHREWQQAVQQVLTERYDCEVAERLIAAWKQASFEINHGLLEGIKAIAPNAQRVLVTNATTQLSEDLRAAELLNDLQHVVNSSTIGVTKPAARFFETALSIACSEPQRAVLIDDSAANIEAARAVGIVAHQHTDNESTLGFLQRCF